MPASKWTEQHLSTCFPLSCGEFSNLELLRIRVTSYSVIRTWLPGKLISVRYLSKQRNFLLNNLSTAAQKTLEKLNYRCNLCNVESKKQCKHQTWKPNIWTKAAKEAVNIFVLNLASIKSLSQHIKEIPLVPKQKPRHRSSELLLDFLPLLQGFFFHLQITMDLFNSRNCLFKTSGVLDIFLFQNQL